MAERYDAGIVTAYGAAVRGGYTGTYDEFCAQQAGYAQSAAAVAQAKTDAEAAAQRAQNVADSIPADYSQMSEDVDTLKTDTNTLKDDFSDLTDGVAVEKYDTKTYTEIAGHLISAGNGNIVSYVDAYCVSDLISVEANMTLYITASANYSNLMYAWYNQNQQFIGGRPTGGSGSTIVTIVDEKVTVPSGAVFLRIAYIKPNLGAVKTFGGYANNLKDRVEAIENIMLPDSNETVTLNLYADDVVISDDTSGMTLTAEMHGSHNGAFNLIEYKKANGTLYKNAQDDICPFVYDGSYRCGNHGNLVVLEVTAAGHGLTETDIGKVVQSANSTPYVIVKIISADKFWIINDSNNHSFITATPPSPLTATGINIAYTDAKLVQLTPNVNNIYQKIYCDSAEIVTDGVYKGYKITIVDGYYSIDTLAMLNTLKNNVGNNTNESYFADNLSADLLYETIYVISGGLAMYVASTIYIIRSGINFSSWGITQSQTIGNTSVQSYIADSTDADISLQSGAIVCDKSMWKDQDFPPYKFFQFNNDDTERGFAIAYNLSYGVCVPKKRKNTSGNVYRCEPPNNKMYPIAVRPNAEVSSGTIYQGGVVRVPVNKSKPLVLVYSTGNRITVEIDTFSDGLNYVTIPNFKGREIEVVHASEGVAILDSIAIGEQIRIYGKGSVSIRIQ